MDFISSAQYIWPQMHIDSLGPAMLCVHQHCSHSILEITYSLFCHGVLKVCIDSRVGNGLTIGLAVVCEEGFDESSLVCMIVFDGYTMRPHVDFKSLFCLSVSSPEVDLCKYTYESQLKWSTNTTACEVLMGEEPLQLSDQSRHQGL